MIWSLSILFLKTFNLDNPNYKTWRNLEIKSEYLCSWSETKGNWYLLWNNNFTMCFIQIIVVNCHQGQLFIILIDRSLLYAYMTSISELEGLRYNNVQVLRILICICLLLPNLTLRYNLCDSWLKYNVGRQHMCCFYLQMLLNDSLLCNICLYLPYQIRYM